MQIRQIIEVLFQVLCLIGCASLLPFIHHIRITAVQEESDLKIAFIIGAMIACYPIIY